MVWVKTDSSDHEAKCLVLHWHWQHRGLARTWVERLIVHIVVQKLEPWGMRRELLPAPANHARVQVESDVSPWARTLLDHLPRESPAAAAKVKHGVELRLRHLEDWIAAGVIERGFVCRTDELTHLEGWNGQWIVGRWSSHGWLISYQDPDSVRKASLFIRRGRNGERQTETHYCPTQP